MKNIERDTKKADSASWKLRHRDRDRREFKRQRNRQTVQILTERKRGVAGKESWGRNSKLV